MSDDAAVPPPPECVAQLVVQEGDRESSSSPELVDQPAAKKEKAVIVNAEAPKAEVVPEVPPEEPKCNGKPPKPPPSAKPKAEVKCERIEAEKKQEEMEDKPLAVHKLNVPGDSNGRSPFSVGGGAEEALLVLVSQVHKAELADRIKAGDILLSANRLLLSGKTCVEVDLLLRAVCSSGNELEIEFVRSGEMPVHLPTLLADARWSTFHVVIRDNVLLYSAPYTTRPRSDGEADGNQYFFVTTNEFSRLLQGGFFIEWGEHDGHFYGTPKPPKVDLEDEPPAKGMVNDVRGPLPSNWEVAYSNDGEKYFIDHNTGTTQWTDPREEQRHAPLFDELPEGWERVEDEVHGVFYVDHINKRTQYEPPELPHRSNGVYLRHGYASTGITTAIGAPLPPEPPFHAPVHPFHHHRPNQPSPSSMTPLVQENGWYTETNGVKRRSTAPFTIDPAQLKGELLTTRLYKGESGFGFTLVGNDGGNPMPEFIQVKSIIPGGAAALDNVLHTGDILVYVDNECMLGASQDQACGLLRSIPPGEPVTLQVCRGYSLVLDPTNKIYSENIYAPATNFQHRTTDRLEISIQKGAKGFGFTISESPQGQRIKSVLYPDQCPNLMEGDLILEVDGRNALLMSHSELVRMLQELPVGYQTRIVVSRQSPRRRSRTPTAGFRFGEKQMRTTPLPVGPRSKTPAPAQTRTFRSPFGGANTTMPRGYGGSKTHDIYEDLQRLQVGRLSTPVLGDPIHRQTPNYIPISALASRPSPADSRVQLITVNLIRKAEGFGFRLVGGVEMGTPLQVGMLIKNGAAERDGRLREGDQIVEIDGKNVVDGRHDVAVNMIKNAAALGHVKLVVRRLKDNWGNGSHYMSTFADADNLPLRASASPYDVHLNKGESEDFGCTLVTLQQNRFIGRVLPDSPAERCGRLRAGDCVVAINGHSTEDLTHPEVIAFIKSCGNHVTFTIDPTVPMPRYATTPAPNGTLPNGHAKPPAAAYPLDPSPGPSQYNTLNGFHHEHRSSPHSNGNIAIGTGLQYLNQQEKDYKLITVELERGAKGFGFSIRGGHEYDRMPLFILRMAEDGPAAEDGRLRVGDQLVEINGERTDAMTHTRAIALIREQQTVRLVVRRPTSPAAH